MHQTDATDSGSPAQWQWLQQQSEKGRDQRVIFTVWCYASAVYAVIVCPSVHPSHVGIVPKQLNIGLHTERRTTDQGF